MVTVNVKDKEYKLYLRMVDVIMLEKELGDNPINLFSNIKEGDNRIPLKFGEMVLIIKYALRQHHSGMKEESVLALVEEILEREEDGGIGKLIEIVMQLVERFF